MLKRKRYLPLDDYLEALQTPLERRQKRDQFYESIRIFYRRKWGCPFRVPTVNGQQLDLFDVYEAVLSLGGWQKVTAQDRWNEVLQKLNIDESIQMAEHAIRFLYMRFLSKFEQNESGNDINDEHEAELMMSGRANRFKMAAMAQPSFTEPPFSTPKASASNTSSAPDFHKLSFALLSGLPNEVSFGLNVLTVLSHPGPFVLNFTHCPALINMLVALCGVRVVDGASSAEELSPLYDWWRRASEYDFAAFWADAGVEDSELCQCVYNPEELKFGAQTDVPALLRPDDRLDLNRAVNWRVFNVLAVFNNLSFESANFGPMGENRALIRFLLLCCNCRWQQLCKIGFETLSNIAKKIILTNASSSAATTTALLRTIKTGLHSDDKFKVMRSMEIVGGLCAQKKQNEPIICDFFEEARVVPRIFTLLTLKDILICVCAMEALLKVSDLGRTACEAVAHCAHAIDMLVGLLTTDAASFGNAGLAGMKVVEMHGNQAHPYVAPNKKNPPPPLKLQPMNPAEVQQHLQQQQQQQAASAAVAAQQQQPAEPVATQQHHHQLNQSGAKLYLRSPPGSGGTPLQNGFATPVPLSSVVVTPQLQQLNTNNMNMVMMDQPPNQQLFMCEWLMQTEPGWEDGEEDLDDDRWSDEDEAPQSQSQNAAAGGGGGPIEPCARLFPSASAMLFHVYAEHLMSLVQQNNNGEEDRDGEEQPKIRCRWPHCDNTPRSLWSITTHLQDTHCTENALEQATQRRLDMGYHDYVNHIRQQFERSRERPPAQTGYTDFAAQEAIRRHAFTNLKREITEDSEGPVTRSIRLTAALILRNICCHSVSGRLKLRKHESYISWMSLSRMESSRTLAQCLSEIVRHQQHSTTASSSSNIRGAVGGDGEQDQQQHNNSNNIAGGRRKSQCHHQSREDGGGGEGEEEAAEDEAVAAPS